MNAKPKKSQSGLIAGILFALMVGLTIAAQGRAKVEVSPQ